MPDDLLPILDEEPANGVYAEWEGEPRPFEIEQEGNAHGVMVDPEDDYDNGL